MIELRDYQIKAKNSVLELWERGVKKALLVLATGTGKTIIFSKIAETLVEQGERILILAHRGELLEQAKDKIKKSTGLSCSLEKAESSSLETWERITLGSVQTLKNPKRLNQFSKNHFDTIIIDEAHHVLSDSYLRILEHFNESKILGVTATPDRGDMKNLGQVFESLAFEYEMPQAIKDGFLTPIKAMTIPITLNLDGVSLLSGDFKLSDIDSTLDPYLEKIAEEMAIHCENRKTVVFLPLIETSKKFKDILNKKGLRACEVNGDSKDREEILKDFENGKYNVLCNSMLLTEGWDCPSVDCIVVLRPTKVRSLYCQIVGRGTRLFKGKDHLLLLDFLWHSTRHSLCRPASLYSKSEDVEKKMTEKLTDNQGMILDLEKLQEEAEKEVINIREQALVKQLQEMRKRKRALVDPLQFEMSINAEDLVNYTPSFAWEQSPASRKQLKALEAHGIFSGEIENAGKAHLLIQKLEKRRKSGFSSPRQIRFLESRGFKSVGTWRFEEAKRLIDRIALNNWKIPRGIIPSEYDVRK